MQALPSGFKERFPDLANNDDSVVRRMLERARQVSLGPGETIFSVGTECHRFLMIVDGSVRVVLTSVSGRTVTLYRIEPGGTCVLTTSCLLGGDDYPAIARTETPVIALAVNRDDFDRALTESSAFRRFVFSNFAKRLAAVIRRMESVALTPVDQRLAQEILRRAGSGGSVRATHEELALEVGSAREVVSRRLKTLEKQGFLEIERGQLIVTDLPGLRKIGGDPAL